MAIVDRVKALGLPLDQIVVIGSGVMDALGLRTSHDIDLAVSGALYLQLRQSGLYTESRKHDEYVLERDDVEIWQDWGADLPYQALCESGVVIDRVRFCHPSIVLRQKQARLQRKDLADIILLQSYLDKTA